jgi:molecular chaperone GrpE
MSKKEENVKQDIEEELELPEEQKESDETPCEEQPKESPKDDQSSCEKNKKCGKDGKKQKEDEGKKEPTELEKAQAAAEDYKRKWYSVSAEYDNYRKRNAQSVSQAYADGKAEAILKLLPVADTFGYAYDGASDEKTKAGIDKIIKNFNTILSSLGVEEVDLKVGDEFDEGKAEAIMNMPCGEGEQPNTIKQVLKKGYKQGDKVIRFAQVIVTI